MHVEDRISRTFLPIIGHLCESSVCCCTEIFQGPNYRHCENIRGVSRGEIARSGRIFSKWVKKTLLYYNYVCHAESKEGGPKCMRRQAGRQADKPLEQVNKD